MSLASELIELAVRARVLQAERDEAIALLLAAADLLDDVPTGAVDDEDWRRARMDLFVAVAPIATRVDDARAKATPGMGEG